MQNSAAEQTAQLVIYHNADKRGPLCTPLNFHTSRSAKNLQGRTVWAIEGRSEGRQKVYRLRSRFVVEAVTSSKSNEPGFRWQLSGGGEVFDPPFDLRELVWFPEFLRSVANFSLGLSRIPEPFVTHFEALLAARLAATTQSVEFQIPERALSIRQPYAEMILRGIKTIEYRSRRTKIRGPFAIHAAKTPGPKERFDELCLSPGDLPTGVIVGIASIHDCRQGDDGSWEWLLEKPMRLKELIAPEGRPQPVWFRAFPR